MTTIKGSINVKNDTLPSLICRLAYFNDAWPVYMICSIRQVNARIHETGRNFTLCIKTYTC